LRLRKKLAMVNCKLAALPFITCRCTLTPESDQGLDTVKWPCHRTCAAAVATQRAPINLLNAEFTA
jgi:hypothetical protein